MVGLVTSMAGIPDMKLVGVCHFEKNETDKKGLLNTSPFATY